MIIAVLLAVWLAGAVVAYLQLLDTWRDHAEHLSAGWDFVARFITLPTLSMFWPLLLTLSLMGAL